MHRAQPMAITRLSMPDPCSFIERLGSQQNALLSLEINEILQFTGGEKLNTPSDLMR